MCIAAGVWTATKFAAFTAAEAGVLYELIEGPKELGKRVKEREELDRQVLSEMGIHEYAHALSKMDYQPMFQRESTANDHDYHESDRKYIDDHAGRYLSDFVHHPLNEGRRRQQYRQDVMTGLNESKMTWLTGDFERHPDDEVILLAGMMRGGKPDDTVSRIQQNELARIAYLEQNRDYISEHKKEFRGWELALLGMNPIDTGKMTTDTIADYIDYVPGYGVANRGLNTAIRGTEAITTSNPDIRQVAIASTFDNAVGMAVNAVADGVAEGAGAAYESVMASRAAAKEATKAAQAALRVAGTEVEMTTLHASTQAAQESLAAAQKTITRSTLEIETLMKSNKSSWRQIAQLEEGLRIARRTATSAAEALGKAKTVIVQEAPKVVATSVPKKLAEKGTHIVGNTISHGMATADMDGLLHGLIEGGEKDLTKDVAHEIKLPHLEEPIVKPRRPITRNMIAGGAAGAALVSDEAYHVAKGDGLVGLSTAVGDAVRVVAGGLPWWAYPVAGVVAGGVFSRNAGLPVVLGGAGLAYGLYSRKS